MKLKAECTWGDGPDVMLNINDCEHLFDLTSEEAKQLAHGLIMAAYQADELQRIGEEHDKENNSRSTEED